LARLKPEVVSCYSRTIWPEGVLAVEITGRAAE
jgi:hypothetical protein